MTAGQVYWGLACILARFVGLAVCRALLAFCPFMAEGYREMHLNFRDACTDFLRRVERAR